MLKKLFVYVLVVGAIIYVGILFSTPYYHYYGLKSDLEELADLRNLNIKEIRAEIQESVHYYGVPVQLGDFSIERTDRIYWIKVQWEETVNVLDIYERNYFFSIDNKDT